MAKKTAPKDDRATADARRAARLANKKQSEAPPKKPKTSTTQTDALKPLLDPHLLAYVEGRMQQVVADHYANIEILQSKIKELRTQLISTQELLTKMAQKEPASLNPVQPDDRYLLTRAKLIKLMKHLGYS